MIDAHHHLWKYSAAEYGWITPESSAIRRDFLPPQLEEMMHHFGIEGTVAVQARQTMEETSWLLSLSEQHPLIRGVVGWVPLTDGARVKTHLERFAANRRLRAVRHVVHDEPDPRYILRDDFNAGVATLHEFGLRYDILIFRATSAGRHRICRPPSQTDFHPGSHCQAAHRSARDVSVGQQYARNGQAAKCLLQAFRNGHRSSGELEAARSAAVYRRGARRVRTAPHYVRIGLASAAAGKRLRPLVRHSEQRNQ